MRCQGVGCPGVKSDRSRPAAEKRSDLAFCSKTQKSEDFLRFFGAAADQLTVGAGSP